MTDLLQSLYQYLNAYHRASPQNDPDYAQSCRHAASQENRLRERLSQEEETLLDDLMYELSVCQAIELETMFRSTLALSRELAALVRP